MNEWLPFLFNVWRECVFLIHIFIKICSFLMKIRENKWKSMRTDVFNSFASEFVVDNIKFLVNSLKIISTYESCRNFINCWFVLTTHLMSWLCMCIISFIMIPDRIFILLDYNSRLFKQIFMIIRWMDFFPLYRMV